MWVEILEYGASAHFMMCVGHVEYTFQQRRWQECVLVGVMAGAFVQFVEFMSYSRSPEEMV